MGFNSHKRDKTRHIRVKSVRCAEVEKLKINLFSCSFDPLMFQQRLCELAIVRVEAELRNVCTCVWFSVVVNHTSKGKLPKKKI